MFGIPTLRPRVVGLAALGGVVLVAVLIVTLWWWIAASIVRGAVERWIADQTAAGITVSHGDLSVSGWPSAVRLAINEPKIAGPGYVWSGEKLAAEAPISDFSTIAIGLPGHQRLDLGGASIATSHGLTGAVKTGASGEPVHIDLVGETADLIAPTGDSIVAEGLSLALSRPEQLPTSHRDTGLTAALTVHSIKPAGPLPSAFAGGISGTDIQVRIQGVPPRPVRPELDAWSKDGGTIEIDRFRTEWGPTQFDVSGTLALDNDLQPLGAFTLTIRDADAALTGLGGHLPPNVIRTARLIIGMLSKPAADGRGMETKVPVSVQDREVYVGPIRVARFPAVAW